MIEVDRSSSEEILPLGIRENGTVKSGGDDRFGKLGISREILEDKLSFSEGTVNWNGFGVLGSVP